MFVSSFARVLFYPLMVITLYLLMRVVLDWCRLRHWSKIHFQITMAHIVRSYMSIIEIGKR